MFSSLGWKQIIQHDLTCFFPGFVRFAVMKDFWPWLRWILRKLHHLCRTPFLPQENIGCTTICMWAQSSICREFLRSFANNYCSWTHNFTTFRLFPMELRKIPRSWPLTTWKLWKMVIFFMYQTAKKIQLFRSFGLTAVSTVRIPPRWLCIYMPRDPTMTTLPNLHGENTFKPVLFQRSAGWCPTHATHAVPECPPSRLPIYLAICGLPAAAIFPNWSSPSCFKVPWTRSWKTERKSPLLARGQVDWQTTATEWEGFPTNTGSCHIRKRGPVT